MVLGFSAYYLQNSVSCPFKLQGQGIHKFSLHQILKETYDPNRLKISRTGIETRWEVVSQEGQGSI